MSKKFEILLTTKFKKQLKIIRKRPDFNYDELDFVINRLSNDEKLPAKYKNHLLNPKSMRYLGMPRATRFVVGIYER